MRSNRLRTTVFFGLLASVCALRAQPSRISGSINGNQPTELPGNTAFKTSPQDDRGPVDPSFPMTYVTLYVMPTPSQQTALDQLLAAQKDPSSPQYHRWLTPEQYAARFGLNSADLEKIANWLQSEGFTIRYKARGRNWIAFSGTAGQMERTFGAVIHHYLVDGEMHFANATNASVPAALAGVVGGLRGLNDFHPKPSSRKPARAKPSYTGTLNLMNYLAPGDIATIYDLNPLYNAGIYGADQTIVVVGQSDIYVSDIAAFRSAFGLSPQVGQQGPNCDPGSLCLVLYGDDPGYTDSLDEGELDVEWAGAVARDATILYLYSTSALNAAYYAIDSDLGKVLSMSYGDCEPKDLQLGESLSYAQSEAQKGNSMGITWLASSGDTGAADCDGQTASQATHGLAVNAPASTPEVTAVGGTEFNEGGGSYWNYFSGSNGGSAKSYIPETSWNDTAADGTLAASGGGVSSYFLTPVWQSGPGFPNDGGRDLPDVALSASAQHDPYIYCYNNTSCFNIFGDPNYAVGGTSASTPVFAGIVALLNEYLLLSGSLSQPGLGNINPTLYWLADRSSCSITPLMFHDITSGSNIVPCQPGSLNCVNGNLGYTAQTGYDQVTGLGSVDGYELVTGWATPPALAITKAHTGNFAQGQTNAAYTLTVSNSASAGATSGLVTVSENVPAGLALTSMTGSGWTCSGANCTRCDALNPGASYPPITVLVNVAGNAPSPQINQVTVNGGGTIVATASDSTSIVTGPLPDLIVSSLSGPNNGNPAGSIKVAATVLNQGSGSAGPFQLEFYFSPTSTVSLQTAIDTTWGCSSTGLAAGSTFTCSGPIAIPVSLTPGTWYLAALADSSNQVFESNENNNWRIADTGSVTLGAALQILGAGTDGNLYSIVPSTGVTNLIGSLPAVMSDIAAYNGALYGISFALNSLLFSINPNTGAGIAIGTGTGAQLNALAFSSSGTLYAAGGDSLYTVNTATGLATLIGSGTGAGSYLSSGDLEFDGAGDLYLTSAGYFGDQLFSIDPTTGQGALIGSIGSSAVLGLAYYDGVAYGFTAGGQVISIDLSTGVGTALASYSPGFDGTTVIGASTPLYTISGPVNSVVQNMLLPGVTITLSGSQNGSATTNSSGVYSFSLPAGGNYTLTPTLAGYSFEPPSVTFTILNSSESANFIAYPLEAVSGQVTFGAVAGPALSGVTITFSGSQSGITITNSSGAYSLSVAMGSSITITPSLSGYTFSPSSLTFTNLTGGQTANFTATAVGLPAPPFGSFDTPAGASSSGNGSLGFTGWALSSAGISSVDIWREANPGEAAAGTLLYIGTAASIAGARPDIQAMYPSYPGAASAGWGFLMLTNELPSNSGFSGLGNGAYRIHALAHDLAAHTTDLGVKTLVVDNRDALTPFGGIDTPAQGGVASGSAYVDFGWALTPPGKTIPTNGSTIWVYIDNQPVGHPVYNNYRIDIATLFPGYANSAGAVGYFYIDTTKLTNGLHTIFWTVTDSSGAAGGIGSRFFTVNN